MAYRHQAPVDAEPDVRLRSESCVRGSSSVSGRSCVLEAIPSTVDRLVCASEICPSSVDVGAMRGETSASSVDAPILTSSGVRRRSTVIRSTARAGQRGLPYRVSMVSGSCEPLCRVV
jgi:hypothetical protein